MALSGTIYGSTVGGGYRLEIDWSATQNTSANQSTVTAKVYWHSLGSGYTVSSSATKNGSTTIDGTTSSWSTAGASLSGNERKLVNTYSRTVTHASDGTKTLTVSAIYDVAVTLSSYVASVSASGSITLNTIPREWTLSSSTVSFTAGNSVPLSFNVTSSSFNVTVVVKVNGVSIATRSGITSSSYTVAFSALETQNIFTELNKDTTSWNQSTEIDVTTYSGSTLIGSTKTYPGGTCSSPTVTQVSGANFNIGDSTTVTLSSEQNAAFVYDLTAVLGSYTKTLLTKGGYANQTWATSGDATSLYGQLPSSKSGTVTYNLTTYWANGTTYTKVRTADTATVTATVPSTQVPTYPNGAAATYTDTNSVTSGATKNAAYIVQGQSTLTITLPTTALATASSGTSISYYQAVFGGKTNKSSAANATVAQTFTFTATDLASVSSTQNATIQAVDARGNLVGLPLSVNVVPYALPTITASAARDDGFSNPVTIKLSGAIAALNVAGTNQNSIKTMVYNYSVSGKNTWQASDLNFTAGTATFPNYAAADVHDANTFSNSSAWDIKITVSDQVSSYTVTKTVGVGVPIFFIDSGLNSVSVGKLPEVANRFEVKGTISSYEAVGVVNPNTPFTTGATLALSFSNDQARIRYGGSGNGSANGLQIQGTSDVVKWGVDNNGAVTNYSHLNIINAGNLYLKASGTNTDPGDVVFQNGDGTEKIRFYTGSTNNELYIRQSGNKALLSFDLNGDATFGASADSAIVNIPNGSLYIMNSAGTLALRLVTDGGNGYIQAGKDLNDTTNSRISLSRTGTTSSPLLSFYAYASNVYFPNIGAITSGGSTLVLNGTSVVKISSSRDYKWDIQDMWESEARKILNIRPVLYRGKPENTKDRQDWSFYGLIAEEVAEVAPRLVYWGKTVEEDGTPVPLDQLKPEGVIYERLAVMMLPLLQQHEKEIQALKKKMKMII